MERIERGMPTQSGALDARRKCVDSSKGREVADLFGCLSAGDDLVELLEKVLRNSRGLPLDLSRHQRRTSLGNGTAGSIKGDILDEISLEAEIHAALIPTGGIVAMCHAIGRRQFAAIPRTSVMVKYDLLIEICQIGHDGEKSDIILRPRPSANLKPTIHKLISRKKEQKT